MDTLPPVPNAVVTPTRVPFYRYKIGGLALWAWVAIVGGFIGFMVIAILGTSPGPIGGSRSSLSADVGIRCSGPDVLGGVTAHLRITNSSSRTRSYWVDVAFYDSSGARVGTTSDYVSSVGPGQTVAEDATTWIGSQQMSWCKITRVS